MLQAKKNAVRFWKKKMREPTIVQKNEAKHTGNQSLLFFGFQTQSFLRRDKLNNIFIYISTHLHVRW